MRAALNGDGFVDDITLNTGLRCEAHFDPANTANNAAIDHNIICYTFAFNRSALANSQQVSADVALYSTLNLDIARCYQIAGNCQV